MKEKYFSSKFIILTIVLFTCLFIFSIPSLALIPGDFGSSNNGPPDGCVDFEDLMIFALAYGSTSADANWNPLCDIAGLGSTIPDGVIDFEDLMIFALHYGECECILPSTPTLSDPGDTLQSPATYTVSWSSVSGATSYVLQEATSSDFISGLQEYPVTDTSKSFSHTVTTTTTYYYRVAAIDSCGQSGWSNVEDIEIEGVPSGDAKWTVMAYMDGDNDLEYVEWLILGRMESVGSTEEVNIVVQMDPYDDCTGTFRYYVTGVEAGSEYPLYPDDIVQTLPEQDMSDPTTLTDFINWAGDNYPADHYMLFLVDHGAGWREEDGFFKGIIWDDTTGGWEHIDIPELAQSLENANINIDILDLDACNMQMIEVAWELGMEMSTPPNYLIGSETIGWINGLPYDDILNQLTGNPSMEQLAICETIVSEYIDNLSTSGLPATISALHFNNEFLSNGLDIINNFANALLASTYQEEISSARSNAQAYVLWDRPQYKDLYDFAQIIKDNVPDCQSEAQAIMDLVNNVIVAEGHSGPGMDNSYGLSIYLIDSPTEYDSSYDLLRFATDTQWDEFLVSGEGVITGVTVIPITSQVSTGLAPETISAFEEESNSLMGYQIANINNSLKGDILNWLYVRWDAYYEVDGYRVYRKINNEDYTMIFDWQNPPTASGYGISDPDFSEGNTYSYYVTAYGTDWETTPSEIVTITITSETFLPPCSLTSPTDGSIITDTNPAFSWSPVGLGTSDLPYGQVYSGDTLLIIYDANTFEPAWYVWFDDMTTSSATYDQNGNAYPLIPGHNYRWYIRTYGYDNNGNWVASSHSETWEFSYDGPAIVSNVEARAVTRQVNSKNIFQAKVEQLVEAGKIPDGYHLNEPATPTKGVVEYIISVYWDAYPEATGYKIYRSINGESYSIIFQNEPTTIYDGYVFWDEDVSVGNPHTYYVTAYGSGWETDPSLEVTIDTWLPPCSLISPTDQSVITDPTPTFTWNPVGLTSSDFPYGSIYSGGSDLWVYDETAWEEVWWIWFANMTTSASTYNQDGQATSLVSGHSYIWDSWGYGYDESGKMIAISESEDWYFTYE